MIKKWKYNINNNETIIILGARRSGKSIMTKYLLCKKDGLIDNSEIVLIMTTGVNIDAYNYLPADAVFKEWRPDIVEGLMKKQEESKKEGKKLSKITLVLDDVMTHKLTYDKTINKLFFTGRHYNISLIILCQSTNIISHQMLSNTDILMFFRIPRKKDKKRLIENLLGGYGDEKEIYEAIKEPDIHEMYIFSLTVETERNHFKERLFKFKVPEKFVKLKIK